MNKLLKQALWGVFLIAMLAVIVLPAFSTQYTKAYTVSSPTGWSYLTWSHTFLSATDTLIMSLGTTQRPVAPEDTILGLLNVYTSSLNGDSVDISVRFQTSGDGVNWKSYTVGTDSTTWVSALTGTNYTLNTFIIGRGNLPSSYGGDEPYKRIYIFGNTGNNTVPTGGTKVKVDWIK